MRILKLTLKKKWFDMILSGEKKEEYRELKKHWEQRLEDNRFVPFVYRFKEYDAVEFTNGYGKDKPRMLVECIRIDIDDPRPEWYGENPKPCYVIFLGKILETHNL